MRQSKGFIAVGLIVLIMLAILGAAFAYMILWNQPWQTAAQPPLTHRAQRDMYTIEAAFSDDLTMLTGEMRATLTNRADAARTAIPLRLYANAIQTDALTLADIRVNGQPASWTLDAADASVARIAHAWAASETLEASWRFTLTLPRTADAIGMAEDAAVVVGGLPVCAPVVDGAPQLPAWDALGETSYAEAFDWRMTLRLPRGAQAVTGGALVAATKEADGGQTLTAQRQDAREIALAACRGGVVRQRVAADGTLLTALASNGGEAAHLLDAMARARESLAALGLPDGATALSAVQAQVPREDGIAASGLLVLAGGERGEALLRRVTRLCARQIFGIAVENDPFEAPWLSHALSSACELLCYRHRAGEAAYDARFYEELEVATRLTRPHGVTVGAAVTFFGSDSEMMQVLRDQGAVMLLGIEQAVGETAFVDALRRYVAVCAGHIATADDLLDALWQATGSRWDGYLLDGLST